MLPASSAPVSSVTQPLELAEAWNRTFVDELYASGSAYTTAAAANVLSTSGLLNVDPTLLQVRSREEMATRLSANFTHGFTCKVS